MRGSFSANIDWRVYFGPFICVANINRQAMAMESTVGESKALVMKKRILDLNKDAKVNCVEDFVNKENVEERRQTPSWLRRRTEG